jgi:AraC family transcriptional regulator of adaptative response/methylated-DNA-[protein]-cysteine methyltransferase
MQQSTPERIADDAAFARIAQAITFLRGQRSRQPGLDEVAAHIGLSASHTQRLFTRWTGVSPKRFLQFVTVEYAKRRMAETADLLALAADAGLSGSGRLHDLFVAMEAVSPGEFRQAARGMTLRYGTAQTPFGRALVVSTPRGICHLSFTTQSGAEALRAVHDAPWAAARLVEDREHAAELLTAVFARDPALAARGLSLWVSGTNFQVQVWRALLRVPRGGLVSYRQLAGLTGRPRAARSVGSAVARNPVALLIPCHRVLRDNGDFGDYHWGRGRKAALCAWEADAVQPTLTEDSDE